MDYWKLEGKLPVRCDLYEWAKFFEDIENRCVAQDTIGEARISTVFLGINHNYSTEGRPVLFETMRFIGNEIVSMRRYATYEEAEDGHQGFLADFQQEVSN